LCPILQNDRAVDVSHCADSVHGGSLRYDLITTQGIRLEVGWVFPAFIIDQRILVFENG
jgi:hypothetical protein